MQLVTWWYDWGMFLFAFIDLVMIVWVIYDSSMRDTPATGWRLAVIVPALLLIPAIMWRFAGPATQVNLANLQEPFFWIGLAGGIIPFVVGVGYLLSVTGSGATQRSAANVCPIHGQYDARYAACPTCAAEATARRAAGASAGRRDERTAVDAGAGRDAPTRLGSAPPRERVAKANALLYVERGARSGSDYRLNVGATTIGRSSENDIVLDDDTVSRQHAIIREEQGRFSLSDRGSLDGTYLNGEKLRGAVTLQDGDEIGLGNSLLRFKVL